VRKIYNDMDPSITTSTVETCLPFIESDADAPAAELRARMAEQGYLFFRGLVPVAPILELRHDVLEVCARHGWVDTTHDLMDGVSHPEAVPTVAGEPAFDAAYREILQLPRFDDFALEHNVMAVTAKILDVPEESVLAHPRRIGRVTFPNYEIVTTPPHQDYFYVHGTAETFSCWIPLGPCPMSLGSLAVWPGSHRKGALNHTVPSKGPGGLGVPVDGDVVWHTADFEIGDTLFFHSHTIHKALPNRSDGLLRISTDNRYQRPDEDIDPAALRPHISLS